jgi:flagellar hook assembly protein FlgD
LLKLENDSNWPGSAHACGRRLVNARQHAGVNSVVWDGRDESGKEVSSGIYIYRIQAGESVKSRKLSFVR